VLILGKGLPRPRWVFESLILDPWSAVVGRSVRPRGQMADLGILLSATRSLLSEEVVGAMSDHKNLTKYLALI
jgi:hypothetical protein